MESTEKKTEILQISEHELINILAEKTGLTKKVVLTIFQGIEDEINSAAEKVSPEQQVQIKLLKGFNVILKYKNEKITRNPQTNKECFTPEKISVSAKTTRSLTEKITKLWKRNKETA